MMAGRKTECWGHYNFDHIAYFAHKRFVEGFDTVALLQRAHSEREREEIVLVCMLDLDDDVVKNLDLECRYANECNVTDCRERLKAKIERQLKGRLKR